MNAPFHVGTRLRRASSELWRVALRCSSAVGRRPVRPRDSTTPAAFPRCLLRRLRFVWAMVG